MVRNPCKINPDTGEECEFNGTYHIPGSRCTVCPRRLEYSAMIGPHPCMPSELENTHHGGFSPIPDPPKIVILPEIERCEWPLGCNDPKYGNGKYCKPHKNLLYNRKHWPEEDLFSPPGSVIHKKEPVLRECEYPGCDKKTTLAYCRKHSGRVNYRKTAGHPEETWHMSNAEFKSYSKARKARLKAERMDDGL